MRPVLRLEDLGEGKTAYWPGLSPEQRGAAVELARLRAELAEDRQVVARCLDDGRAAVQRWRATEPDRPWLALAALALHGWYTGIETALGRIARVVDQRTPVGATWHRDLLSQCMTEVPAVRPQVLPGELQHELLEFLEFRSFFRQVPGMNLDPDRLREGLARLIRVDPLVSGALDLFDRFLERTQGALAE
jgi:hypothetical protein